MRTYQSNTKDKKKLNKKTAYVILMSVSVVAVAAIITLSLIFGGKKPVTTNTPPPDEQVVVDPIPAAPEFVVPMDNFTVGMYASLTRIVYMSSMNNWRTHNGIDLLAEAGSNVYAVMDGVVKSVKFTDLEAAVITIEHADGLVSYYMGLSEDVAVAAGDTVKSGDKIGTVAAVMPLERDEGAHLHLEMRLNTKLVDPLNYLPELADK